MPHEEMVAKLEAYLKHIIFAQDFLATYKSILDAIEPYNAQINLAPGSSRFHSTPYQSAFLLSWESSIVAPVTKKR